MKRVLVWFEKLAGGASTSDVAQNYRKDQSTCMGNPADPFFLNSCPEIPNLYFSNHS
jgi:hypothetical protein